MADITKIKCPVCKKVGDWFAAPYGPFCSRRCKLVDLGKWFNEEHTISEPLR
ncbi:MAG TPA: DNA gyrase inhibitor YacG, partial [Verrucomicrobiae bacterium]|nr:DNA gyrase inhibitor YacG [Verrucomicrobiae bacterium]